MLEIRRFLPLTRGEYPDEQKSLIMQIDQLIALSIHVRSEIKSTDIAIWKYPLRPHHYSGHDKATSRIVKDPNVWQLSGFGPSSRFYVHCKHYTLKAVVSGRMTFVEIQRIDTIYNVIIINGRNH